MTKSSKKFKVVEKNAKNAPTNDIIWEGEEVSAQSDTKIEEDKGTGQAIILRVYQFAANPAVFKAHKPTAQELFSSHIKGIEALLWSDGLKPFTAVEPRLVFSKDKKYYRFIIPCIAGLGQTIIETTNTLSQLLNETPRHSD